MVPLDRALVSSYKLSLVTTLLTEAVWPQFTMQVSGGAASTPHLVKCGVIESKLVLRVEVNPICFFRQFFGKIYHLTTIQTLHTAVDRKRDETS